MKRLLLFVLFITLYQSVTAQSWQDTVQIINKLFNRYQPNNPGCQLAISRNGKIIFSKAWGLADIENDVPYTIETVTEAGSISKQFTAVAILLLEQQGKLSLEDDVRKYFPALPDYGSVIRLKNLLHHTSGIREWSNLAAITGWPRTTKAYRNEDVLNMLCRQQKLNNIPGAEFIYSNSNYVLLALVVEKVSGMSLARFTQQYIFKPAGMTHTSWRDNYKKVVPNRGIAYAKRDNGYELNMPNESVYGPGGLLTTTEDLLKWNSFYQNNKLGGHDLLEKQLTIDKLPGGAVTNYAAGLFIDTLRGLRMIYHDGQTASYVGIVESCPKLGLSIAYLSNTTEFKNSLFDGVTGVENLFIKGTVLKAPEKKVQTPVALSIEKLKKHTGWYSYEKTNEGVEISLQHDTLLFKNTALIPISETQFRYKESVINFNNKDGFLLTTADKRRLLFKRENATKVSPDYLKGFTGTYYSKETESRFKIIFKEDKLLLEQNYIKDVALLPAYQQAFNFYLTFDSELYPQPANILFERNSKNKVIQCQISMNDARGITFVKIQ